MQAVLSSARLKEESAAGCCSSSTLHLLGLGTEQGIHNLGPNAFRQLAVGPITQTGSKIATVLHTMQALLRMSHCKHAVCQTFFRSV